MYINFGNIVHEDLVSMRKNRILEDLDRGFGGEDPEKGFGGKLSKNCSEVAGMCSDFVFVV